MSHSFILLGNLIQEIHVSFWENSLKNSNGNTWQTFATSTQKLHWSNVMPRLWQPLCVFIDLNIISPKHIMRFSFLKTYKKYRKAVRWCASLTWLILLIWLFWMIWLMKLNYNNIFRLDQISCSFRIIKSITISHGSRFCEILHQNHNIS